MKTWYDVVIIGAGLAGLAAANELLHYGSIRLLLVDSKFKAHAITNLTFADVIADFELQESVLHTYRAFAMRSTLGSLSLHHFREPALVALDYRRACQLMLDRIANHTWLSQSNSRVVGLRRTDKDWEVSLDSGEVLHCALVIDASGKAQVSARLLGHPGSPLYSHCYGERLAGCEVDNEEICYFLPGGARFGTGGGWFYPLGSGVVSFGYAQVTNSAHYPASKVRAGYQRARTLFKPYASIVSRARRVSIESGSIPVGPVFPFTDRGLMRVGDAAGQAKPWVCMGVEPALINGSLCGRIAAEAYHRGTWDASLPDYERTWRRANWRRYCQALLLAPLQWVESEQQGDRVITAHNRLTPDEMLAKLRENYPPRSLPTLWWLRLYHELGRMRRGVRDRIDRFLRTVPSEQ